MRPLFTFLAGLVAALAVLGWIWGVAVYAREPERLVPPTASTTANTNLLRLTGSTARLSAATPEAGPTAYSQAVYAATQHEDKPGAVVLVCEDDELSALTATRLQHMPVNAPMLFVTETGVSAATRAELRRLDPQGVAMDHNVQVYLVGDIPASVEREVRALGFRTRRIFADNPTRLAEVLDEFLAVMESDHRGTVMIGALSAPEFAMPAANWNAHEGDAFAWVTSRGVPPETRRMLMRRGPSEPEIYVFAPPGVVSAAVMAELTRYGHVERIPGATPQEMSVRWASYKDSGLDVGWWFGDARREPGWGITQPGHNFIVGNPADWREVGSSGVLSHMGKHAPLLLTNADGSLPTVTSEYLGVIRPTRTHPSQQVYNSAWIVGRGVPDATQDVVSDLLTVQDMASQAPQTQSLATRR